MPVLPNLALELEGWNSYYSVLYSSHCIFKNLRLAKSYLKKKIDTEVVDEIEKPRAAWQTSHFFFLNVILLP